MSAIEPSNSPDPASSGYQLLLFWGETIRTYDLPAHGEVSIGRDKDNAISIDDPSVSRRHAILRSGEHLELQDLGGANGTFVRGAARAQEGGETLNVRQVLGKTARLSIGDSILFGTASAVVRRAPVLEVPDLAAGDAGIVVRDPGMQRLYADAARAARSTISVLLLGETGVGKEVLARTLHASSPRKAKPFVAINCAALSESLLEAELFGHERGAFTGAIQARAGLFEAANGGTVFLDEVGEMPLATQAKLLRVIEERTVMRVGSTSTRAIDVRFVAATNRDLEGDSSAGRFRQDLYFRLSGIALTIPPLRERLLEIEILAQMFLKAASRELEQPKPLLLSAEALSRLCGYSWPGNVRELRHAIDRAAVLCTGDVVRPEDLPPALSRSSSPAAPGGAPAKRSAEPGRERDRIEQALAQCGGNQTRAAKLLGISRRTLVTRIGELGLRRPLDSDEEMPE